MDAHSIAQSKMWKMNLDGGVSKICHLAARMQKRSVPGPPPRLVTVKVSPERVLLALSRLGVYMTIEKRFDMGTIMFAKCNLETCNTEQQQSVDIGHPGYLGCI